MEKQHRYRTKTEWTGNLGEGTRHYNGYDRAHTISVNHKPDILASSDPAFRGDPDRHNPEELFLASLSSCHMLWYLHLCTVNGIKVMAYEDNALGIMTETSSGSGCFSEVLLSPIVTITDKDLMEKANALHHEANKMCFIANSCNFPVKHQPKCLIQSINETDL